MRYWVFLSLLFVMAGCESKDSSERQRQNPPNSAPTRETAGEIGSTIPEFAVVDLNGNKISTKDLKNKITIINFWATWCPPCRKEMPGFEALKQKYQTRGLEVIGFKASMMNDTEDPVKFLKELGIHYRIVVSSDELEKKFGGLQGLPTTLIYDRKGILRSKVIGFEYTEKTEATIRNLL